jgi:hypothetical protein
MGQPSSIMVVNSFYDIYTYIHRTSCQFSLTGRPDSVSYTALDIQDVHHLQSKVKGTSYAKYSSNLSSASLTQSNP